jgi:hypothetical protein
MNTTKPTPIKMQTGVDMGADETVEKHESPDDEYQRRFDEHERQWDRS